MRLRPIFDFVRHLLIVIGVVLAFIGYNADPVLPEYGVVNFQLLTEKIILTIIGCSMVIVGAMMSLSRTGRMRRFGPPPP